MRRLFRGSLPLRVFAISVIIFAVPLVTYFLLVLREAYHARLEQIVGHLNALGRSRAVILGRIRQVSGRALNIADQLLTQTTVPAHVGHEASNAILTAVQEGGDLSAVFLVELQPDGRFVCTAASDPELIGKDFTSFHFVSETLLKGQMSFLSYGETELGRSLFVTKALSTGDKGILVASEGIGLIIKELVSTEGTDRPIQISLVTADDVIFASGDTELIFRVLSKGGAEKLAQESPQVDMQQLAKSVVQVNDLGDGALELKWNGYTAIGVEVPVHELDVSILLSADETQVFESLYLQIFEVMTVFVFIFAVGGWISLWLTERMARPFAQLRQTMRRVSEGDLDAKFQPSKMGFEINQLGHIFNATIEALKMQMASAEEERVEKERYLQELKIGTEIQRSLLPLVRTEFPGVEIAARYLPAREVGGDFYDVFVKSEPTGDRLLLTIADAAGKGVSACLYSLGLRSAIRSSSMSLESVHQIMSQSNDLFCHDTGDTGMFVTAFTALYDPKTHLLSYTSSGHTPGLLRREAGGVEPLTSDGMALGVMAGMEVDERSVELRKGDFLFLYTDGITEAHNSAEALFGEERLRLYLESLDVSVSAEEAQEGLIREVERFMGGAQQYDDITLLVFKMLNSRGLSRTSAI